MTRTRVGAPKNRSRLSTVLRASRPISWVYWFILLGNGMLQSRAIPSTSVLSYATLLTFTFSIPVSIIFNGVNDVFDFETDRRNPRKLAEGVEGGVLDPADRKDVVVAAYVSTVLMLLSSLVTQSRDNLLGTVLLLIIIWQYSVLPLRIKEIPLLDSLSNGCIAFLVWFFGFSLSGSRFCDVPLRTIVHNLCVVGGHALAAAIDSDADAAAGQRTIATTMGKRPTIIFAALCFACGSLSLGPVRIQAWLSSALMIPPCFKITWAHRSMQAVVLFIVGSHATWVVYRYWSSSSPMVFEEIFFDIHFLPLPSSCKQ